MIDMLISLMFALVTSVAGRFLWKRKVGIALRMAPFRAWGVYAVQLFQGWHKS
jgi:hypothetical protein